MSDSETPVFWFPGDDPEMEQAAARARQTFRFFWRELAWEQRRIIPGLELAAVKAAFFDPPEIQSQTPETPHVEHMWLMDVDFDGRHLYGTLINSPHSLQTYAEGDQVTIPGMQISDWMYVISGNVYGGFTVDMLRSRMQPGERKQHDQAWGFDFGEVGMVNLVPPEFFSDSPARKKSFFSFLGTPKPVAQDYAKVAATEHPMSVNMRKSLDETLASNPGMVHEKDERGFTFLHQLALAGSWDGVDICLKHGADPQQTTPNGMTPLALAKSLNWTRVMERLQ
ncbi:DUF2314 domain-containing protein [Lignipirellula cremea]|uniref:DUF2314 domain-containing protein n=1 Tax=Lignipirellula cremea TaxID=2528010 RepID=A0A518DMC4_9BACT|nr:DUF2314 domain-containing protein [Lignipirellula cremea]QDU92990.1 hypothetical protein Pla8534_07650 [Lignipirellula cremea]